MSDNDRRKYTGDEIPRRGYKRRTQTDADQTRAVPTEGRPVEGRRTQPPPIETPPPVYDYGQDAAPRYGPAPGTPPPPRRGLRGRRAPRDSGLYLPWWSLVILIVFVGVAALGILMVVLNIGTAGLGNQTPQFVIVTSQSQPNINQEDLQNQQPNNAVPSTVAPQQQTLPTLVPSRTPLPLPEGCVLNAEVIVFGTGAIGLNMREQPQTGGTLLWTASEGDRLQILDGPQYFDDYEWCKVSNLSKPGQTGWAVTEFMISADETEQ